MGGVEATGRPDPGRAADLPEFIHLLAQLRTWAGEPSLRVLARRVGPLMRPPRSLSPSTLGEIFQPRRRRLDLDLVLAIVRALGADEPTVDQWRSAYMRVQLQARSGGSAVALRQLPADLATFTGRADAVRRLLEAAGPVAGAGPRTVVISAIEGMAGIGKTRLAVHVAHELLRAGRFADIQLYADLCGFDPDRPPADPASVLDGFLRQLGEAPHHIPDTLEARAAMFRDRMYGRDALLLLDNAAGESQVRDLIPADPRCLVLITSRRSLTGLDGAHWHVLDVFTPQECLSLLEAIVGRERVAAEPRAAADLIEAAGRLPLAVSLLAARLRSRPAWSISELNDRLREDLGTVATGGRSFVAAVELSYRGLPDATRRVFRLLGLYPGTDFSLHAVAALADLGLGEARAAVDQLADEHLVQDGGAGRYEFHDLIRRFAADLVYAEVDAADRDQAMTRLLLWYVATAATASETTGKSVLAVPPSPPPAGARLEFREPAAAMQWCESEHRNMFAAIRYAAAAGIPDLAWRISSNMFHFFHARLYLDDWLEMLEAVEQDAAHAGDPRAVGVWTNNVACVHLAAHRYESATEWFERAKACFEAIGHRRGLIGVINNQAMILQAAEKTGEAVAAYEEALEACTPAEPPTFPMIIMNNIATLELDRGRPQDALTRLLPALELARRLESAFTEGKIRTNLAIAYRDLGRLDESMEHSSRALDVLRSTGNELDEARVVENIGVLEDRRGDRESALAHWRSAHATLAEHGDPHARVVAARLAGAELPEDADQDADHAVPEDADAGNSHRR